jgi:hypothetical protein
MVEVELKVTSSRKEGLLIALCDVLMSNQFSLLRQRRINTPTGVLMTLLAKGPEACLMHLEEELGTHHLVNSLNSGPYIPNMAAAPIAAPAVNY